MVLWKLDLVLSVNIMLVVFLFECIMCWMLVERVMLVWRKFLCMW